MNNKFLKIENGKINFSCMMNDCRHSCCGPFASISNNLNNIDNRPFDEIVLTETDLEKMIQNGCMSFVEQAYSQDMRKTYFRMALEEDGSCKAFHGGRCGIQECKPTLCKAFPFYFDMFSGLCAIRCEGFNEKYYTSLKDIEPCLKAARDMYEFWIKFYTRTK